MRSARRRTAGSYWALGIACPGRRHAAIASLTSQLSLRRRACPLHAYQHLAELRRTTFDIAPAAIAKVLAAVILVWLWLQLWQLLMLDRSLQRLFGYGAGSSGYLAAAK